MGILMSLVKSEEQPTLLILKTYEGLQEGTDKRINMNITLSVHISPRASLRLVGRVTLLSHLGTFKCGKRSPS